MANTPQGTQSSSGMEIPDYAIERIARCMLPMIRAYYESEEGKRELAQWQEQKRRADRPEGKQT